MAHSVNVRRIQREAYPAWKPLWDDYNSFYGRKDVTALPAEITEITWKRFFDPDEPVFALVAVAEGKILGLTHYLFHRSTTRIEPICYLEDLFTAQSERCRGIGRALIAGVVTEARSAGIRRLYWQTHCTNTPGRLLYDTVAQHDGFIVYSHKL